MKCLHPPLSLPPLNPPEPPLNPPEPPLNPPDPPLNPPAPLNPPRPRPRNAPSSSCLFNSSIADNLGSSPLFSFLTSKACRSLISAFFSSRSFGGMPCGSSCADNNSFHSEFMNLGVFFSKNPVKLSCIFFGSGYESVRSFVGRGGTVVVSSRSEKV